MTKICIKCKETRDNSLFYKTLNTCKKCINGEVSCTSIPSLEGEIWADVDEFPGDYMISNYGRVKSIYRIIKKTNGIFHRLPERILKQRSAVEGRYFFVALCKDGRNNTRFVHRLIAKAFIPNPNNYPIINHKDCNKQNNSFENLEWCTIKHNTMHAVENGLLVGLKGEDNGATKLRTADVLKIRELSEIGKSRCELARIFKVSTHQIKRIADKTSWAWLA